MQQFVRKFHRTCAAAAFGLCLAIAPANSSILINTAQVGSGVVFSFSGTFDVSNLVTMGVFNDNTIVGPSDGAILFSGADQLDGYQMVDKLPAFGTSGVSSGTATGDIFKLFKAFPDNPAILGFEQGYAGELISGNLTISNSTFAALGLIAGTYTTTASNGDFVQLNIPSGNAVPLPAALPLFATGLGALGLLGWRRKRKAQEAIAAA